MPYPIVVYVFICLDFKGFSTRPVLGWEVSLYLPGGCGILRLKLRIKVRRMDMVDPFETFPHLLAPLKIGNTVFRNRMFCAPTGHADIIADGQPSTEVIMVFERVAIGGAAMVSEGEVCVDPREFREGRWPREITRLTNYNYPHWRGTQTWGGGLNGAILQRFRASPHLQGYGDGVRGSPGRAFRNDSARWAEGCGDDRGAHI